MGTFRCGQGREVASIVSETFICYRSAGICARQRGEILFSHAGRVLILNARDFLNIIIDNSCDHRDFASIDPAPPTAEANSESHSIEKLEQTLLDTKTPLFIRYRAMFGLRDLASPPDLPTAVPAILALAKGLHDPSALFRHEIAFVFGQLSHPASIPALTGSLSNLEEASMVRHEAAEALGSLGDEEGVEDTLKKFLHDKDQVVRDSVIVALDMAEFEKNGETEYALIPEKLPIAAV